MAELGAAGSIVGIVAFGLKLGSTLQTYVEAVSGAEDRLGEIVHDVTATASALDQLCKVIANEPGQDDDGSPSSSSSTSAAVFSKEGLADIASLATKCEKIYRIVIELLVRASRTTDLSAENIQRTLLDAAAADQDPFRSLSFFRRLRWPWLEPKIRRYREQLYSLKMHLLFLIQVARFAQVQNNAQRDFQRDLDLRLTITSLQRRPKKHDLQMARLRAEPESDSSSYSSDSVDLTFESSQMETQQIAAAAPRAIGSRETVDESPGTNQEQQSAQVVQTELSKGSVLLPQRSASQNPELISDTQAASPPTENGGRTVIHEETPYQEDPLARGLEDASPSALHPPTIEERRFSIPRLISPWRLRRWRRRKTAGKTAFSPLNIPSDSRIFGNSLVFAHDWPSTTLEAYMVPHDHRAVRGYIKPIKVDLGHCRLTCALENVLRNGGGTASEPTSELRKQKLIAEVKAAVRFTSPNPRTCVAFQDFDDGGIDGTPYTLLFFSLSPSEKPILVRLEDDFSGAWIGLPFELCRAFEDLQTAIHSSADAFPERFRAEILARRYELFLRPIDHNGRVGPTDIHILPLLWGSNDGGPPAAGVRPGARVVIRLTALVPSQRLQAPMGAALRMSGPPRAGGLYPPGAQRRLRSPKTFGNEMMFKKSGKHQGTPPRETMSASSPSFRHSEEEKRAPEDSEKDSLPNIGGLFEEVEAEESPKKKILADEDSLPDVVNFDEAAEEQKRRLENNVTLADTISRLTNIRGVELGAFDEDTLGPLLWQDSDSEGSERESFW